MKAVFIGRFQPMHNGHHQAIKALKDEYEDLLLVIGSANISGTEENPLTAEEREEIIRSCFPDLSIEHLDDCESDRKWVKKLEKFDPDTVVSGNSFVRELVEEHTDLSTEKPEMFEPNIYSGTEVRRRIKSDEEWRYLVPGCTKKSIEKYVEKIKKSGIQYDFEPGWKRENSSHGITK